jgi:hypothetical protein
MVHCVQLRTSSYQYIVLFTEAPSYCLSTPQPSVPSALHSICENQLEPSNTGYLIVSYLERF